MLITNATSKKLRFSILKPKSESEDYEAFAYIMATGCSLSLPDNENFEISEEGF